MTSRLPGLAFSILAMSAALCAAEPNPSLTGSISQRFEADDNFDLDVNSAGTSYRASTNVDLTYRTQTRNQSFTLSTGTSLQFIDDAVDGEDIEFSLPGLNSTYTRSSATSDFSASANFRRTPVSFLRPFEGEFDDDGIFIPPDDLQEFSGEGNRTNWGGSFNYGFNQGAPVSYRVTGSANFVDYDSAADASLNDTDSYSLRGSSRLQFTPKVSGDVGVRRSWFSADDAEQTDRDTTTLDFGLSLMPNERVSYSVGIEFYDQDTTESGVTTSSTGTNANVGVSYEMPNSSLRANLGVSTTDDDQEITTGSLNYSTALPLGDFRAGVSRSLTFGDDGEDLAVTGANVGFSYPIDNLSNADLSLSYSLREDLDDASVSDVERVTIGLGYNRSLTERINLGLGYTYRTRDGGSGSANSHSVSMSISTPFSF